VVNIRRPKHLTLLVDLNYVSCFPLIAHLPSILCYFGMMVVVIGFLTGFRTILLTRLLDYKRCEVECVFWTCWHIWPFVSFCRTYCPGAPLSAVLLHDTQCVLSREIGLFIFTLVGALVVVQHHRATWKGILANGPARPTPPGV
jgi:hypothetical protein